MHGQSFVDYCEFGNASLLVATRAIACMKSSVESSHYVRERTVQVLHYFDSSTRWIAQVNDQNE